MDVCNSSLGLLTGKPMILEHDGKGRDAVRKE
jgi:hypothetical protein